jgi:hypothetical protein
MQASSSTKSTRSGARLAPRGSPGTIGASEDSTTLFIGVSAQRIDALVDELPSRRPPLCVTCLTLAR